MFSDAVSCDYKPGRPRRRVAEFRRSKKQTPPPSPTAAVALQAKYVFKDSKGSDAVGVELFNGTPGDAASLVGKLDIDLREFRKANASSDAWMRVRPRSDVVAAAPDTAVPRAAPSPARPRRSSSASRAPSARSAAASPRRFRAAGFAPQPPKRSRFPPAAGRRRRAGELHGRPGPGGQGRAVHMPVVGAAALRANWALAFRRADVRLAIVSRACRERVAKVVAPNPRTGEARARRAQIAVRMQHGDHRLVASMGSSH